MASEVKDRAFILKWRSAVWASAVPASAKLCCLCLSEFADSDGSNCYPSLPTIASVTALNEKTVRLNLKLASAAGLIQQIAMGTSKGWKAHRYELQLPEGADISRVRPEHGADTTPVPSENGADTTSAANDPTCGHSVHKVRTLCPDGTGVVPSDLSITYPIPIEKQQRQQVANSPSVSLPEWVDPDSWAAFAETFLPYPVAALDAQAILKKLESLRAAEQDPNQCLDQSAINGWRGVYPMQEGPPNAEHRTQPQGRQSAVERAAAANRKHDEREGRFW